MQGCCRPNRSGCLRIPIQFADRKPKEEGPAMRHTKAHARVIAYAMPQDQRRKQVSWALIAGLLASMAIVIAALLHS